jgi:hypothetical protein
MASLGDVLNKLQDVLTALQTLHSDENDLKVGLTKLDQTLNSRLSALEQALNNGFVNMGQGFQAILSQEVFTNEALAQIVAEQKTMICQLEQVAHHTCDLLSESHFQTGLQTSLEKETHRILQIATTVHPAAEVELQRLDAVKAQVEKCCPEPKPSPICIHEACPPPPDFTDNPPPDNYVPYDPGPPPPR